MASPKKIDTTSLASYSEDDNSGDEPQLEQLGGQAIFQTLCRIRTHDSYEDGPYENDATQYPFQTLCRIRTHDAYEDGPYEDDATQYPMRIPCDQESQYVVPVVVKNTTIEYSAKDKDGPDKGDACSWRTDSTWMYSPPPSFPGNTEASEDMSENLLKATFQPLCRIRTHDAYENGPYEDDVTQYPMRIPCDQESQYVVPIVVKNTTIEYSAKDKDGPDKGDACSWRTDSTWKYSPPPSFPGNTEATEDISENRLKASNPLLEAQQLERQAYACLQTASVRRMQAAANYQERFPQFPVCGQLHHVGPHFDEAMAEPWKMQDVMPPFCTPPLGQEKPEPVMKKEEEDVDQEPGETVHLANIPNNYKRNMLVDLLNERGYKGKYDFVYLPIDMKKEANLGYAFINFISIDMARAFKEHFQSFSEWETKLSAKVADVKWAKCKGLKNHIDRYQNSPVMHEDVPESYRPLIFKDGEEILFPAPTKKIKPPWKKSRGKPAH